MSAAMKSRSMLAQRLNRIRRRTPKLCNVKNSAIRVSKATDVSSTSTPTPPPAEKTEILVGGEAGHTVLRIHEIDEIL